MRDAIEAAARWYEQGRRVMLGILVRVEGPGPRAPGAAIAVDDRGRIAGSISSGCIESDVVERAEALLLTGGAGSVTYRDAPEPAFGVALTCGAEVEVWIAPLDVAWCARVLAALVRGLAMTIEVSEPRERTAFEIESHLPSFRVLDDDGSGLASCEGRITAVGSRRTFVQRIGERPEMIVFGAVDFARAVATVGRFLGFRVTIVDARERFATPDRLPDADEIVVAWPDEYLRSRTIAPETALVVLTHDERFDVPLLQVALESAAGYVGVMGNRRTHARRLAALRELGIAESRLSRMHAPIGLDIGARTPEAVAISIAAEILATQNGRRGGSLRESGLPVHGVAALAGR